MLPEREDFNLFHKGNLCPKYTHNRHTLGISIVETISAIKEKHNTIFGNGYGKLKEQTFRIAHMGDITIDDLKELLAWIDEEIA